MKWLKQEWPQLLLLLLPFCAGALLWDKLPERMPIHWNARGEVDGYASKPFATLFLPLLNVAVVGLLCLTSLIDPRVQSAGQELRANFHNVFRILRLTISAFLAVISLTALAIAAGFPLDMPRVIGIGLGLMIAIFGNFLGKIRPNYFVGVRTPWTLESPDNWVRTHRFAGKIMVPGGVLLVVAALTLRGVAHMVALAVLMLAIAGIPILYSFLLYRKQRRLSA